MAYFGITFRSGQRIILEAASLLGALELAQRDHPGEDILDAVYLTVLPGEDWAPTK
jgi:hypothetical protein